MKTLEAFLYAIQRSGFLISKSKTKIMKTKFVFLGNNLSTEENGFSCISDERAETICSIRIPLSLGELSSRLSFIYFSNDYLPVVRKVSLPLLQMLKSGKFRWQKAESEAFSEVKMLVMLKVRNYIFNPDNNLLLSADASRVCAAYCLYQINSDGRLELVNCKSQIFGSAQLKQSSVYREAAGLMWSIDEIRPYILACKQRYIRY